MSPNDMSFEDLVIDISTELQSMDNTAFTKLLEEHRNGDVAQLILGSGAIEANALEAESYGGYSAQMPSSSAGPMEQINISVQLPNLVLSGECIVSNDITALSIPEPGIIVSSAKMAFDWTSGTESSVIFKSNLSYRAFACHCDNAFHAAPTHEPGYDVTGDEESLCAQAA